MRLWILSRICNIGENIGTNVFCVKKQPWVDTVSDLEVYKPTKEAVETKKIQRMSRNLALAKVSL